MRHWFLRALVSIIFFFALMIVIPYMLELVGIHVPDNVIRVCLGMALLSFIIWGPPFPGISTP